MISCPTVHAFYDGCTARNRDIQTACIKTSNTQGGLFCTCAREAPPEPSHAPLRCPAAASTATIPAATVHAQSAGPWTAAKSSCSPLWRWEPPAGKNLCLSGCGPAGSSGAVHRRHALMRWTSPMLTTSKTSCWTSAVSLPLAVSWRLRVVHTSSHRWSPAWHASCCAASLQHHGQVSLKHCRQFSARGFHYAVLDNYLYLGSGIVCPRTNLEREPRGRSRQ